MEGKRGDVKEEEKGPDKISWGIRRLSRIIRHHISPDDLLIRVAGLLAFSPSTQVDVSSKLGLDGEALILLFALEVRRLSNSMLATLMGRSRMIYDIGGYVKNLSKKSPGDI